ncbi:MAG: ComEC/Rec2 family competence protein [Clostridia bacterium]|nr:ComEC/Rec2 family competence protein [Clostridia bacterium]
MRRPFATVGFSFTIAQLTAIICGFSISAALGIIAILCAAGYRLFVVQRIRAVIPALLSAAIAFGAFCVYSEIHIAPSQKLGGETAVIVGEIIEEPTEDYGRYYYVIKTSSIGLSDAPQKVKMRLSCSTSIEAEASDIVTGEVVFNYFNEASGFRSRSRLLSRGITATAYLAPNTEMTVTSGERNIEFYFARLRSSFSDAIDSLYSDDLAAMLKGIVYGDNSDMSADTLADFRLCGLSHLMAVSGLHLSLFTFVLMRVLRKTGMPRALETVILILGIVFYMFFAGMSPSVRRAGVMNILFVLSLPLEREPDSLNSLGLALLAICAFNPCAAGDVGLLLSSAACVGLILVGNSYYKLLPKGRGAWDKSIGRLVKEYFISAFATSLTVTVFTIPITSIYFGEVSIVAPLASVVCTLPTTIFMVVGAVSALLSAIPIIGGVLGGIIMVPAWLCGRFVLIAVRLLGAIPNAGVSVNFDFLAVLFAAALALLIFRYIALREYGKNILVTALCIAMILQMLFSGLSAYRVLHHDEQLITVYNVGDGCAIEVRSGDNCAMIGIGGDRYLSWLMNIEMERENIRQVDAIFMPDLSREHTAYWDDFVEAFEPEYVFAPRDGEDADLLASVAETSGYELYQIAGARYEIEDAGLIINCHNDENGMMWIYAKNKDVSLLICPSGGDCSLLPQEMREPDIAVMTDGKIANILHLSATVIVVSADYDTCVASESVYRARGQENVYTTGEDGSCRISRENEAIKVRRIAYAGY